MEALKKITVADAARRAMEGTSTSFGLESSFAMLLKTS